MKLNLNEKVALVTGGSHGIGRAICISLVLEGCRVAYCARGERYSMLDTVKEAERYGCTILAIRADITNEDSVSSVIDTVHRMYGKIDILINNIGGGSSWGNTDNWEQTPSEKWEEVMRHNYMTSVWFTNKLVGDMVENNFGRVVSISGVYGKESGGTPWFGAAKSAQIALMKNLSRNPKYVKRNITFNTVCPGFTEIERKTFIQNEEDKIPMGRPGTPEDIAPLVTFLCSEKAKYVNGATIVVDGGLSKSI